MEATDELTAVDGRLVLGRYRLGRRLGAGGFGVVHEAFDERLERLVAVKVIPAGGQTPARAAREALAAARLDHPGIVAVYDAGEEPGSRYLVSELVHGRTLAELEAEGELSDRDVVRVGVALADALDHAHERGVVHRDLKPQNVMVPDRGGSEQRRAGAKLTDFGVAHLLDDEALTRTGDVVGTLAYMAPEQAEGRRVDARTDLYALGLLLYEALAGTHPVRRASPAATARKVGTVLSPLRRARPDLPAGMAAAIDRAVRPRPADRGTVAELGTALLEALPAVADDGGAVARHPLEGPARWPGPPMAVRRVAAALAAGALVAFALARLAPPGPGPSPALAAVLTTGLVLLLPRAGWTAAALGTVALLSRSAPGAALVVAVAVAPVALLRTAPLAWSSPALAPLLGLAGLSGLFPALAGRARRLRTRAALGAVGAWWIAIAEAASGRGPGAWGGDARGAADRVLGSALSGQALCLCALWAAACAVLPIVVRGRHAGLDWLAAAAWAAGLAVATAAIAERFGRPEPSGLAVTALIAGVLAVAGTRIGPEPSSHTSGMGPRESTGGLEGEAA